MGARPLRPAAAAAAATLALLLAAAALLACLPAAAAAEAIDTAAAPPPPPSPATAAAEGRGSVPVPFGRLVWWSTAPVLKVLLLGLVGWVLARQGVLNAEGRRVLSRVIFLVFTPALTFDKLAPVLSAQNLMRWLPVPINAALSIAAGLALGAALAPAAPSWFRNHVVAATGLGNVGNLPLVLVPALVQEAASGLGKDATVEHGVAFVSLGIVVANITHFTIGLRLLQRPVADTSSPNGSSGGGGGSPEDGTAVELSSACGAAALSGRPAPGRSSRLRGGGGGGGGVGAGGCSEAGEDERRGLLADGAGGSSPAAEGSAAQGLLWAAGGVGSGGVSSGGGRPSDEYGSSDGSSPAASVCILVPLGLPGSSGGSGGGGGVVLAADGKRSPTGGSFFKHRDQSKGAGAAAVAAATAARGLRARARRCGAAAWELVTPPLVASTAAVVVGLTPPLRAAIFAEEAPLALLRDVISSLGAACIPGLMMLLGATLERGPGAGGAALPTRVVAAVAAARLLLLPLLGVGWALAAKRLGLIAPGAPRLMVLVALIQTAVPTALNCHSICTMFGNREAEMGALIFYQYLASVVTVPACLALFLHVVQTYF